MNEFDEKIHVLQEKIAQKRWYETKENSLNGIIPALREKAQALDAERRQEQDDVDRLEGHSLAALFYTLTGKKEERLDQERAEVYAAAVKYDAAKAQLDAAENDLAQVRRTLTEIRAAEQELEQLLLEKRRILQETCAESMGEILQLEEKLAELEAFETELNEGIWAGNDVLHQVSQIESKLSSAENWGTVDLIGGGMISALAKHSNLDEAQHMTEHLQVLLQRFRTELADVQVYADLKVNMDGFLRFADYFFDGVFADWAALSHIHNAQSQVSEVKTRVQQIITQLKLVREKTAYERQTTQDALKKLLINA